jgi:4-hydroxybenzoyl-CoA thioesterase
MTDAKPDRSFVTQIHVRFGHVDQAAIVYYPRIYDYIHEAMEDLFQGQVQVDYYHLICDLRIGFPLVHSEVNFVSPLRFGDVADVHVTVFKIGNSSLGLRYRAYVGDRLCFDARMTVACVNLDELKPIPIPAEYRARFEEIQEPLEDQ